MPKANEPNTLWLYFARRDKKSVDVLTVMTGRPQNTVRITDLSVLNLPQGWRVEIERIVDSKKMEWELFAESADNYELLKSRLKKRGYTNLPLNGQPLFSRTSFLLPPKFNTNKLPNVKKMVKRGGL